MTPVDLLALALAARAVLDVWLDEDSVLAELRARTQLWDRWFWKTLFNCRFCLSYHVPALLVFGCYGWSLFLPDPWAVVVKLPLYSLAATGLVRLLDGLVGERMPATPPESGDVSTVESGPGWHPISDARADLGVAVSCRVLLAFRHGQTFIGRKVHDQWMLETVNGQERAVNEPTHYQPLVAPEYPDARPVEPAADVH